MDQDNASIARRTYDSWNARDFDYGAEATADDAEIAVMGSGESLRGPDGSRQYSTMWADAFPDGRVTIDRLIAAGDTVVVEFTGRGTHTGTLTTPMGGIPATGRSVTLQLCDVLAFREGKIVSQHTYFDSASLLAQLGVMPTATQAAR